jgi:TonB family protein
MHRPLTALAVCALLIRAGTLSAQEPAKPAVTLHPIAAADYPGGRAVIEYSLTQPADLIDIDVLDGKGTAVVGWSGGAKYRRSEDAADRLVLSEPLAKPGVQSITWDLRAGGYFAPGPEGAPPRYSPGPLVPPGRYTVRISALGQTVSGALTLVPSPAIDPDRQAALETEFDLAMQVRGSASAAGRAVVRARAMRAQVNATLKGSNDVDLLRSGQALTALIDRLLGAGGDPYAPAAGLIAIHGGLAALLKEREGGGLPAAAGADRYRALGNALRNHILLLDSLQWGSYPRFAGAGAPMRPEAAIGMVTPVFDAKGVDFDPWLRAFVASIKRAWIIPYSARSAQGVVGVSFVLHNSGLVTDISVSSPDRLAVLNESARRAIFGASVAEPLPPAYPDESCPFTVTFYFNVRPPAAPARK